MERDSINGLKLIRYSAMMGWRQRSRLRTACNRRPLSGRPQLRQFETAPALGSTAQRPTLSKSSPRSRRRTRQRSNRAALSLRHPVDVPILVTSSLGRDSTKLILRFSAVESDEEFLSAMPALSTALGKHCATLLARSGDDFFGAGIASRRTP